MVDIVNDVSVITTIPRATLDKLNTKESLCMCDAVHEAILSDETEVEMDIGVGIVRIT